MDYTPIQELVDAIYGALLLLSFPLMCGGLIWRVRKQNIQQLDQAAYLILEAAMVVMLIAFYDSAAWFLCAMIDNVYGSVNSEVTAVMQAFVEARIEGEGGWGLWPRLVSLIFDVLLKLALLLRLALQVLQKVGLLCLIAVSPLILPFFMLPSTVSVALNFVMTTLSFILAPLGFLLADLVLRMMWMVVDRLGCLQVGGFAGITAAGTVLSLGVPAAFTVAAYFLIVGSALYLMGPLALVALLRGASPVAAVSQALAGGVSTVSDAASFAAMAAGPTAAAAAARSGATAGGRAAASAGGSAFGAGGGSGGGGGGGSGGGAASAMLGAFRCGSGNMPASNIANAAERARRATRQAFAAAAPSAASRALPAPTDNAIAGLLPPAAEN